MFNITSQHILLGTSCKVPYLNTYIITAGGEFHVGGGETIEPRDKSIRIKAQPFFSKSWVSPDISDSFFVSRERLDVVHVGLPIFYSAVVVSCNHPLIIVTPYHTAHCRIVSLLVKKLVAKSFCLK